MTMKEAEEQTGLPRSNIRFYEKEKLIFPERRESNGYRNYSQADVETIKKIAYLRTLGISIEEIRELVLGEGSLTKILEKQREKLEGQIGDMNRAKRLCEIMLAEEGITYEDLKVEKYVVQTQEYWEENRSVFKMDSVSFLYLWGSLLMWGVITGACLAASLLFYEKLPGQIPVQWSHGEAVSMVHKNFIFAYPAACLVIRFFLRPFLYAKLQMNPPFENLIAEYLTNYLCFIALSAEMFTILFVHGLVKSIGVVLAADTVVFIGLLAVGMIKLDLKR